MRIRLQKIVATTFYFVAALTANTSVDAQEPASRTLVPAVERADSMPAWNAKFAGPDGWIGGDGAYSVNLDNNRILWLFGDTLLGTVKDGKRAGAAMVNNTVAVQTGHSTDASIRFITGQGRNEKRAALFVPADGKGWYWPQEGIRVADKLYVFLALIEKATGDSEAFGFKQVGEVLGVIENPDDEPEKWRRTDYRIPHVDYAKGSERSWGSALLSDREFIYVYGFRETGKAIDRKKLIVARVPIDKPADFAVWRFLTTNGWSANPADAAPLADGVASEFSVTRRPDGDGFVMVYTEHGIGDRIVARFAAKPEGPWSEALLLYTSPEMQHDKGVFSYAAKAHPWAAGKKELVISYCVNSWEFARLFQEDAVYRPKFVRVKLK